MPPRRLQDLDPFEWEDKSEALDMLKNGVRFSHNGPDRYDGDVERTVWWKERGLDRSGGKKVAIGDCSPSPSCLERVFGGSEQSLWWLLCFLWWHQREEKARSLQTEKG